VKSVVSDCCGVSFAFIRIHGHMTGPPIIIVWDFCPNYMSFCDTATVVKPPFSVQV